MPLCDFIAFRHMGTELFGSRLHGHPPSASDRSASAEAKSPLRCGRHNAEKFTNPVIGVTARPILQPISERFRYPTGPGASGKKARNEATFAPICTLLVAYMRRPSGGDR